MTPEASGPPVALYVHVPFCLSVCPYCDFVVYAGRAARGPANRIDAYLDAVTTEIGLRAADVRARQGGVAPLESVYFGGGTPSLLGASQVERLLTAVEGSFGIGAGAEVTMEANPGPADRGDLAGFRAAGVNRLSIGAQSLDDGGLRRLGRRHTVADVLDAVRAARQAGFDNISLDLMYDIPGQEVGTWRATLEATLALEPDHISAYALTLDDPDGEGLIGPNGDHLPMRSGARRWRERARAEQDDDRAAAEYEIADRMLTAAGLHWYELSNWARPGAESRHNMAYWLGRPWEAVGPGAHASDGFRTRRWNAARLDGYLDHLSPADGSPPRLPPGGFETTDEQTAAAEAAILRLRTRAGLPATLAATLAQHPGFGQTLAWARVDGLVEPTGSDGVRLSVRGRLLSNELFVRLLPEAPATVVAA